MVIGAKVKLTFPEHRIIQPIVARLARERDVVPNIRRARITETVGEMVVELEGTPENIAAGIRYLEDAGVEVEPVEGDFLA